MALPPSNFWAISFDRSVAEGYFDSNALIAPVTCGITSFGTAIDSW
jgi:hypothetical protein